VTAIVDLDVRHPVHQEVGVGHHLVGHLDHYLIDLLYAIRDAPEIALPSVTVVHHRPGDRFPESDLHLITYPVIDPVRAIANVVVYRPTAQLVRTDLLHPKSDARVLLLTAPIP